MYLKHLWRMLDCFIYFFIALIAVSIMDHIRKLPYLNLPSHFYHTFSMSHIDNLMTVCTASAIRRISTKDCSET